MPGRQIPAESTETMEAYAVIETGGKQYRVEKGSLIDVELLGAEPGTEVEIDRVLAVSDGSHLTVGTPTVDGATVKVSVVDEHRGPKVVSFRKKKRKGYTRKVGHRQDLTRIRVEAISGPSA